MGPTRLKSRCWQAFLCPGGGRILPPISQLIQCQPNPFPHVYRTEVPISLLVGGRAPASTLRSRPRFSLLTLFSMRCPLEKVDVVNGRVTSPLPALATGSSCRKFYSEGGYTDKSGTICVKALMPTISAKSLSLSRINIVTSSGD